MNADSKEELVPVLKSTPQADARNRLRSTLSSGACHLGVEFRIQIRQITNIMESNNPSRNLVIHRNNLETH